MIKYDVEQGTEEWHKLRVGIPTASEFDKIITPTGKKSTQWDSYSNRLLAEMIIGGPVESFQSDWMNRGKELEADAAIFYDIQRGTEAEVVGFCTDDNGHFGASPDRLIGEDGVLEIKCAAPHTHIKYLIGDSVDKTYWPQIQGQLLVTGRAWSDVISFHPQIPPSIIRVERDEEYLKLLTEGLAEFRDKMMKKKKILIDKGIINAR